MIQFKNGDPQRFIFEDLCVYVGGIICALGFDFFANWLHHLGFLEHSHPQNFGLAQVAVLLFCSFQLYRSVIRWRYYS